MPQRLTTMNISLPTSMRDFIKEEMKQQGFANASEYVRHLIRQQQHQNGKQRLQRLLQEGLDSGPATPMTKADWAEIRRRVASRNRVQRRKSA